MAEMMRSVVKTTPGKGAELREVPKPEPGPGEALVRIRAASICGTDHHIYDWNPWSEGRVGPHLPQIMGHEFCGVVEETGPGVDQVSEGDYVSAETHIVCNTCAACSRGYHEVCLNTEIIGVDRDGAFADYIAVPAGTLSSQGCGPGRVRRRRRDDPARPAPAGRSGFDRPDGAQGWNSSPGPGVERGFLLDLQARPGYYVR